jgi:DNA-binding transcriptional ArsR family regulator
MPRAATTSDVFNAIAEPQRRRILDVLQAGERAATDIAASVRLTAPATSKHLRVLREVGLVRARKEGRQRHYALDATKLREVHAWAGGFERFWSESLDRLETSVKDLEKERDDANG